MQTKISGITKRLILLGLGIIAIFPLTTFAATNIGTNISTTGSLTVNGNIQFTSGAAAGRVLTSDAAGNATWQSYSETDPVYSASSWFGTTNNSANWDTAYGWGDHSLAGYLTAETDPLAVLKATFTTNGDLLYGTGAGTYTRLGVGTNGQVLTLSGGVPTWQNAASGFADPMTTRGDLIYRDATNTTTRLGVGTAGQVLKSDGTDISWTAETDPVYSASSWFGTTNNSANWDTAYGWGDHSTMGYLTSETDPVYSASSWFGTTNNSANWDTAYGWGDHSTMGYLTSETDPVYSASSWFGTTNNSANWDTAYGWGDHSLAGYLTAETDPLAVLKATFTTNGDLLYGTGAGTYTRLGVGTNGQVLTLSGGVPTWQNAASGFADPMTTRGDLIYRDATNTTTRLGVGTAGQVLKSDGTDISWTAETDPVYSASSWFGTTNNSANWDTAYGWGDHSTMGYLTSETDPVYSASSWFGTTNNSANWDTAYGWGDHSTMGYLTSETDPVYSASSWFGTTNNSANWDTAYGWGDHSLAGYLTAETDPLAVLKATFTTNGDLLYGTGAGTYTRLGVGTNGQVLTLSGGVPTWQNAASGFADPMTTRGDLIYRDATNTTTRLGVGTAGQVLKSDGTDISWTAETDPVYSASSWFGTTNNSANWDTAYGWGDHSTMGYLTSETDPVYSASSWFGTTNNSANWDTAYGWGDHSTMGYLTSETDPVYSASSWFGTTNNSANWDTAYGWGDHSLAGYLTAETDPLAVLKATFTTNGDLLYGTGAGTYTRLGVGTNGQVLTLSGGVPTWQNAASGFADPMTTRGDLIYRDATNTTTRLGVGTAGQVLKSDGTDISWTAETDPVYSASSWFGTTNNSANWDTAYGWGDHSTMGYLTSETDPVYSASSWFGTTNNSANWDTAYGWGDHSLAGYLTAETDPLAVLKATFTTNGDLLYGTGAGTYTRLGVGTNGQVLTLSGGVPTWQNAASGFADPMTTRGDLIYRDATNTTTRLGVGTAGQVLKSDGTDISWTAETDPVYSASSWFGTTNNSANWDTAYGWGDHSTMGYLTSETDPVYSASSWFGTTNNSANWDTAYGWGDHSLAGYLTAETDPLAVLKATFTTNGDLLYGTGAGTYTRLGVGTNGQVLTLSGGVPTWQNAASGFADPMTTRGDLIYRDATNTTTRLGVGTAGQVLKSDGTDISWTAETDPVYSASSWFGTTNNSANWDTAYGWGDHSLAGYLTAETDPLAVLKATFTTNGDLLYGTGAGTYTRLGVGTNGQVLTLSGGVPTWQNAGSGSLPSGTTTDSILRWDGSAWVENTSVLANTSGQITASSFVAPASSALTITGNAASTWSTTAGNLILQAGSGVVSLGTSTNLTASGTLTIDSNTTNALNIGTGANAKTITIGNSTGATSVNLLAGTGNITLGSVDTTGTLLVLDTKTDAGDPTGTNGAMYYNSNTGKFRCYESGVWKNCDTTGTGSLPAGTTNNSTLRYDSGSAAWVENTNFLATSAGAIQIGAGTAITKHLSQTFTNVTTNSIASRTCSTYATLTFTGVTTSDTVLGVPQSGVIAAANLGWNFYVSAANTIIIEACNSTTGAINTADTETWRIDVWQH